MNDCMWVWVWVCVLVDRCMKKGGAQCCRAVATVTNLLGPLEGNRSKVTELWLDKHRSSASISYPVHFGNTWLFLVALGPKKIKKEERRKGQKGRRGGKRRTTRKI